MAHGAQVDGIAGLQQVDGPGGHHAAPAEIVFGAPVEILEREIDVVLAADLFKHAFALRDDFGAHAVAGDHRDGESGHCAEDNFSARSRLPESPGNGRDLGGWVQDGDFSPKWRLARVYL